MGFWECGTCDRTFATEQGRDSHCQVKGHWIPPELYCDLCDRSFYNENAYDQVCPFSTCCSTHNDLTGCCSIAGIHPAIGFLSGIAACAIRPFGVNTLMNRYVASFSDALRCKDSFNIVALPGCTSSQDLHDLQCDALLRRALRTGQFSL